MQLACYIVKMTPKLHGHIATIASQYYQLPIWKLLANYPVPTLGLFTTRLPQTCLITPWLDNTMDLQHFLSCFKANQGYKHLVTTFKQLTNVILLLLTLPQTLIGTHQLSSFSPVSYQFCDLIFNSGLSHIIHCPTQEASQICS